MQCARKSVKILKRSVLLCIARKRAAFLANDGVRWYFRELKNRF